MLALDSSHPLLSSKAVSKHYTSPRIITAKELVFTEFFSGVLAVHSPLEIPTTKALKGNKRFV